jgi:hypothetical protein
MFGLRMTDRMARYGFRAAWLVSCVALASVLAFVVLTFRSRILDGVEGALLFDASRLRQHHPLWVDPAQGAWDYGAVPSRYYVAYTGLWACVLSLFPAAWGEVPARTIATLSWFGLLAWIVARCPRDRRWPAWVAAVFVGGVYTSALFGSAGRPDAPALLLSAVALERSIRRDRVGFVDGALFALAAFIKPNVLGLSSGAFLGELWLRRWRAAPAVLGGATATGGLAWALARASDGQWWVHVMRANYGAMRFSFWIEQLTSGLQFFGLPLAFTAYCAWRARRQGGVPRTIFALVSSAVWAMVTIAKAGGTRNYWMEPCVAAVLVFSVAPVPPWPRGARALAAVLAIVQALWTGVASIRSSLESIALAPARRSVVVGARAAVRAQPDEIVLGEDPGLEWMLDGRSVQTPIYMTALGWEHRYPVDLWIQDVERAEVVGLVTFDDLLERPLSEVNVSEDLFLPALRIALTRRFVLVERAAGLYVYALRERR